MNITMICNYAGIRMLKEAFVLHNLGYQINLIFGGPIFGPLTSNDAAACKWFKSVHYFTNKDQLATLISTVETDFYHVYAEPYGLTAFIKYLKPEAKILLECQDSGYWKTEGTFEDEDKDVELSDVIVAVSEACKKELETRTDKEIIIIPSACPQKWFTKWEESQPGICNQGGHTVPSDPLPWRDYTEIYETLSKKTQVYAYSPQFTGGVNLITDHYKSLNVKMANIEYKKLIKIMASHTWNLVGNYKKFKDKMWTFMLPNKFYDAVAAGIPSVVIGCPEVAKIVNKYKIGIECDNPDELFDRWDENKVAKENLLSVRDELSMDNQIQPLVDIYERGII